jgi:hypothetical protein
MLTQTTTTLPRGQTTMLGTDNNANNNATTQTMGDDVEDNNAAADVDAAKSTTW